MSTVGRWLKAERLRPWRSHSWQHIHHPETFLQRARPVLDAYLHVHSLFQRGTWLLSLDEKTSIQAREGEQPPRPACPGKSACNEARSHRRGARHLFAGLSIADGMVLFLLIWVMSLGIRLFLSSFQPIPTSVSSSSLIIDRKLILFDAQRTRNDSSK